MSVLLCAAMMWISLLMGDPGSEEISQTLKRIEATMANMATKDDLRRDIDGLEMRINGRFANLTRSLATRPGAPPGIDEDVEVYHAADANWVRDPDAELEDRLLRRRINMPDAPVLPPVAALHIE
jgi:hypothetical protein